jgi:hypothetical protein
MLKDNYNESIDLETVINACRHIKQADKYEKKIIKQ